MTQMTQPYKPVRTVAAFDFDHTITTRDTLLPFLTYVTPCPKTVVNGVKLLPMAIGYKMGLVRNHDAKEAALTAFLRNRPVTLIEQQGIIFSQQIIPKLVRPHAIERIKWHQQQGHLLVIVSAGLEVYLTPWAQKLGFDTVIGTKLMTTPNGMITGKIDGLNCYGEEKVRRLEQAVGPKDQYILYAYGDSRGDRELLALADYPFYRKIPTPDEK